MARDEFFRDIRSAVSFAAPRVDSDSPFTDLTYIERLLRGTDVWLAPGIVDAFRPEDFHDLGPEELASLTQAVEPRSQALSTPPARRRRSSETPRSAPSCESSRQSRESCERIGSMPQLNS